MKKKILFSLLTIAVVGALVGVGVHAYFSDIETSARATFSLLGRSTWTSQMLQMTVPKVRRRPGCSATLLLVTQVAVAQARV